jgi:hypothetical protein
MTRKSIKKGILSLLKLWPQELTGAQARLLVALLDKYEKMERALKQGESC